MLEGSLDSEVTEENVYVHTLYVHVQCIYMYNVCTCTSGDIIQSTFTSKFWLLDVLIQKSQGKCTCMTLYVHVQCMYMYNVCTCTSGDIIQSTFTS